MIAKSGINQFLVKQQIMFLEICDGWLNWIYIFKYFIIYIVQYYAGGLKLVNHQIWNYLTLDNTTIHNVFFKKIMLFYSLWILSLSPNADTGCITGKKKNQVI